MESNSPEIGADELQFEKAQFSGRKCGICASEIADTYYQIGGVDSCPACAQARLANQSLPDSSSRFLKGLMWGAGAALAGSAGFAIVLLVLKMQLALLSIAVGWLVGKAIRKGTEGHTSRKYQIMAVVLTYLSISSSYVPLALVSVAKKNGPASASTPKTVTPSMRAPTSAPTHGTLYSLSLLGVLILALPLMIAFNTMPAGILTLLILFFGLSQAWRQTKPDDTMILGPYSSATIAS